MEKPPLDPENYKYLGSIIGAFQSLLFLFPKTGKEALIRFAFSVLSGSTWFYVALEKFGWDRTPEKVLGASALIAFVSWFVTGPIVKMARKFFQE